MMRLDHVGIRARDVDASVRFYTEALGLTILERLTLVGREFIFVGGPDVRIEIEKAGDDDAAQDAASAGQGHFALVVDKLDERIARLRERGAKIIIPPVKLRDDRRIAFIADPDGARIQLIEFVS